MKLTTLRKRNNMNMAELDRMIHEASIENELNMMKVDRQLLSDTTRLTNVIMDTTDDDVYMFNSDIHKLIVVSVNRKTRKERIVNIDEYRNVKALQKKDLSSDELRFIAANL